MNKLLKESARNASNRGFVFEFDEFRQLVTTEWSPDCGIDFIRWISARFPAVTLLLGALRSEQLDRFRGAGLQGIDFNRDNKDNHHLIVAKLIQNRDDKGINRPMATSCYARVKNRNCANPHRNEDDFQLTIPCLCANGHEPIGCSSCYK